MQSDSQRLLQDHADLVARVSALEAGQRLPPSSAAMSSQEPAPIPENDENRAKRAKRAKSLAESATKRAQRAHFGTDRGGKSQRMVVGRDSQKYRETWCFQRGKAWPMEMNGRVYYLMSVGDLPTQSMVKFLPPRTGE